MGSGKSRDPEIREGRGKGRPELYSQELRRRVVKEAAPESLEKVVANLTEKTGAQVGKRQAEELGVRAAMATVATVYTIAPHVRGAEEVIQHRQQLLGALSSALHDGAALANRHLPTPPRAHLLQQIRKHSSARRKHGRPQGGLPGL